MPFTSAVPRPPPAIDHKGWQRTGVPVHPVAPCASNARPDTYRMSRASVGVPDTPAASPVSVSHNGRHVTGEPLQPLTPVASNAITRGCAAAGPLGSPAGKLAYTVP